MREKATEGAGGRPVAFLPWVGPETASEAPLGSPDDAGERGWAPSAPGRRPGASERSAEPSAHVARRLPTFEEAGEGEEADPDGDIIAEVPEEIDPERIADRIVRGLVRKSLSVAEVEARLYAEGVSEKDALEIVERFTRFGYLDDRRMAGQLVVSLRDRKKLGRSLIQQELRARKLDPEAIASALDELDGDDEYRTALDLARKRLPSLRSLSDDVAERRLTGFLARRGYGGALVQRVVRETVRRPGSGVRFR